MSILWELKQKASFGSKLPESSQFKFWKYACVVFVILINTAMFSLGIVGKNFMIAFLYGILGNGNIVFALVVAHFLRFITPKYRYIYPALILIPAYITFMACLPLIAIHFMKAS